MSTFNMVGPELYNEEAGAVEGLSYGQWESMVSALHPQLVHFAEGYYFPSGDQLEPEEHAFNESQFKKLWGSIEIIQISVNFEWVSQRELQFPLDEPIKLDDLNTMNYAWLIFQYDLETDGHDSSPSQFTTVMWEWENHDGTDWRLTDIELVRAFLLEHKVESAKVDEQVKFLEGIDKLGE